MIVKLTLKTKKDLIKTVILQNAFISLLSIALYNLFDFGVAISIYSIIAVTAIQILGILLVNLKKVAETKYIRSMFYAGLLFSFSLIVIQNHRELANFPNNFHYYIFLFNVFFNFVIFVIMDLLLKEKLSKNIMYKKVYTSIPDDDLYIEATKGIKIIDGSINA